MNAFNNLKKIKLRDNLPNVMVTGDFNLPDISLDNHSVNTNSRYSKELNDVFLNMVDNNTLSEIMSEPTRYNKLLDLVLTYMPGAY